MPYSAIFSFLIVIYFIRDQFEFSKVTKTKFLLLPIFCLYQFFTKLNIHSIYGGLILIAILVSSALIAWYQSKDFEIRTKTIPSTYFIFDQNHQQVNVYQKLLYSKGGKSYLIGWLITFLVTLLLSSSLKLEFSTIMEELNDEIIKDLSIFSRIKDGNAGWISWGMLGFTDIAYLFFIGRKSSDIKALFASVFY